MKIRKGDKIKVLYGAQKGKTGVVEKVLVGPAAILVTGLNIVKRHLKGKGIIDVRRPLDISKVQLTCPHCKKETRVGFHWLEGKKARFCKKCRAPL